MRAKSRLDGWMIDADLDKVFFMCICIAQMKASCDEKKKVTCKNACRTVRDNATARLQSSLSELLNPQTGCEAVA